MEKPLTITYNGRITATYHAVERYISRHAPHLNYNDARIKVITGLRSGSRLKKKSIRGHFLWKFGSENVIGVAKQDNGIMICVTILPQSSYEINLDEEDYFSFDRFNYQEEINGLESNDSSSFLKEEILALEQYKILIKEKFAFELEKHKLEINKHKEIINHFDVLNKLEEKVHENKRLKSNLYDLEQTNERYKKIIDLSLDVITECLSYLLKNKTDPNVQEILFKINNIDPTLIASVENDYFNI